MPNLAMVSFLFGLVAGANVGLLMAGLLVAARRGTEPARLHADARSEAASYDSAWTRAIG